MRPAEVVLLVALVTLSLGGRLDAVICNERPPVELELVRFRQQKVSIESNTPVHEFLTNTGASSEVAGEFWSGPFSGSAQVTFPQRLSGTFRGAGTGVNLDYLVRVEEPFSVSAAASGTYTRTEQLVGSFLEIAFSGICFASDWDPSFNLRADFPPRGESVSIGHSASCTSESVAAVKSRWRFQPSEDWPETGDAFDEVTIGLDVSAPGSDVAFFGVYRVPRTISCIQVIDGGNPRVENTVGPGESVVVRIQGAAVGDATAVDLGPGIEATVVPDGFFGDAAEYLHVEATVGCLVEAGPRTVKITTPRGVVESDPGIGITVTDILSAARGAARTSGNGSCPADIVELRNEMPSGGTEIEEGQEQEFRATALYNLNTLDAAQIDLELRDDQNDLVGASSFAPAPGGSLRTVQLAIPATEIPLGTRSLFLRARIIHEGRVVIQSAAIEYPVGPERSVRISPASPTVFAGDDLSIDLEIVDASGNLASSFSGDVEIELVSPGTPDVGALKLPGAGASTSTSATVPISGGRGQVVLQTPRDVLTQQSVITPRTVLEGVAVLEAKVAGRERKTTEQVRVDSPLDLFIDRIEVQQAVAGVTDLVRFRPLIVRLHVATNESQFDKFASIEGILASVRVVDGLGNDFTETATAGGFVNSHAPNSPFVLERRPSRAKMQENENTGGNTLNVIVPTGAADGDSLRIVAELDDTYPERDELNNDKEAGPFPVRSSRTVTIQIGRATWDGDNGRSGLPSIEGIARAKRMFALLYPISDGKVRFVARQQATFDLWPPVGERLVRRFNRFFDSTIDGLVFFVDDRFFALSGAEDPGTRLFGSHFTLFPIAFVASTYCVTQDHCATLAHELGHHFGLDDTYDNANFITGAMVEAGSFDWATLRGPFGGVRGPFVAAGDGVVDFMGNSDEPWVNAAGWNYLREKFELESNLRGATSGLADGASVFVQGTILRDGTGALDPCYIFDDGELSESMAGGNASIETVDGAGTVLDELIFDARFPEGEGAHELVEQDVLPFGFSLPFSDAVREIRLRVDGSVVASRAVSAAAPEISLDPVAGPFPLTGERTVTWSGRDADGDALTYSLYYSPDGSLQIPLLAESPATEMVWDTDQSPAGAQPMLTLIATDGVRTSMVSSEVLSLSNRSPQVLILTPEDESQYEVGTEVSFEADFSDLEDPFSLDPSLTWTSDRQGVIGNGSMLAVDDLLAGRHLITCSGRDDAGAVGSDSIFVTVTVGCPGDCDANGRVAIAELIRGVRISLGTDALANCPSFDSDGNGAVRINELIRAVSSALNGCPEPMSTPTQTGTATSSRPSTATASQPPAATDTPTPGPASPSPPTETPAGPSTATPTSLLPGPTDTPTSAPTVASSSTATPSSVPTSPPAGTSTSTLPPSPLVTPSPTSTADAECPSGPLLAGGSEWYLSCAGASCDETCSGIGMVCDESATAAFAGSAGSDANCELLLFGFGIDAPVFETDCDVGAGCLFDREVEEGFRCASPSTTCTGVELEEDRRACVCVDTD